MISIIRFLVFLLAFIMPHGVAAATGQDSEVKSVAKAVYTFGVVPQFEQRKLFRIWRPILNKLEQKTGYTFKLVGSQKISVFEKKFLAGEFDFAYMNPYHILLANKSQSYKPLVRDDARKLRGILVVKKDGPIKQLAELDHQEVAFPAPNALGASLLMRADLKKLYGLNIIPRYVQTHSSVYLHVALGQTKAGGGVARTLTEQKPEVRDQLQVLYKTRPMTPHPIAAHSRIPQVVRDKVTQAFLELGDEQESQALLARIPINKIVAANLDDYIEMHEWGLDEFYVPD